MKYKLFILLFSILCITKLSAQGLYLSSNGMSLYKIRISQNADQEEIYAAEEFQKYFETITTVHLDIQKTKNFNPDEKSILIAKPIRLATFAIKNQSDVTIKTSSKSLILTGSGKRGVRYAVYSFFEKYLGCRFFALDEILIPKKKNVQISTIDYTYSSPFTFRSYYSLENADKNYADFNKQNYFFEDRLYPAHSFAWLIPADNYFKTNPEFFALVDGKRKPTQMCFSSKGLYTELVRVLKLEIAATPNQVWSVSHLDSPDVCHCDLCEKAYKNGNGFTETLIPFVNKIAIAFPDKTISTLAYNQSLLPSQLVKPEKNVEIMFCFTQVDKRYPINSLQNKEAPKFLKAISDWKKQTNNIFVWDYNVNYFHSLFPFPNITTFQEDIKFFESLGAKNIFMEGIGPQKGEFSELKSYLASQLLWDPSQDANTIKNEFIDNYYGSAAEDIKRYILRLESQSKIGQQSLDVYANPVMYKSGYLSQSNLNDYKKILQAGLQKVKQNSKYYERVKKELLSIEYADLEISSLQNSSVKGADKTNFNDRLNSFKKEAQKINITNLRNGEFTLDEFLKSKSK